MAKNYRMLCLEQEREVRKDLLRGIYSLLRDDLDGNYLRKCKEIMFFGQIL